MVNTYWVFIHKSKLIICMQTYKEKMILSGFKVMAMWDTKMNAHLSKLITSRAPIVTIATYIATYLACKGLYIVL